MALVTFQLGKKGLTAEFIASLKSAFGRTEHVRIAVLKSATRDKKELAKMADKILAGLGQSYTCKVIGFTIVLRKWRKAR